jgi:predicted DCC family thiol-disulfide oxidoreductase YuxK
MDAHPPRIVLFDGVCGLCNATVDVLIRLDTRRCLMFAPLQGETAAALRETYPEIPSGLDSVVLIDEGRVFLRFQVLAHCARHFRYPWRLAHIGRFLPNLVTDPLYNVIARFRYRWFGKKESCRIPTPEERAMFLP